MTDEQPPQIMPISYYRGQNGRFNMALDLRYAPQLFNHFKKSKMNQLDQFKLQNFILFLCSMEKIRSLKSVLKNKRRLQLEYEITVFDLLSQINI